MVDNYLAMRSITSESNPRIKAAKGLLRRRGREKSGQCLLEGVRLVQDSVLAGAHLKTVFVTAEFAQTQTGEELAALIDTKHPQTECFLVTEEILKSLSDTQTPQGVVAVAVIPNFALEDVLATIGPFLLVADQVRDPGNLGTMVRTAAAAGCTAVVLTKGTVDAYSGKVLRATMGSAFRVPIVRDIVSSDLVTKLQLAGCPLVVADAGADTVYHEPVLSGPCAIVIGNEATGPDQILASEATISVRIPLQNGVESLNAAVAAAILVFEAAKQRR